MTTSRGLGLLLALLLLTLGACVTSPEPAPDGAPEGSVGQAQQACDDGSGGEQGYCGDGACVIGEDCWSCPNDCGSCTQCGNASCEAGEDCWNCPGDCGSCSSCGNYICEGDETCSSCPNDCGSCSWCGNWICEGDETCSSCPNDCGSCSSCGNYICESGEDCWSCPNDCGSCSSCGNYVCESGEDPWSCPHDCGSSCGNYVCESGEDCWNCPNDCGSCIWCGNGTCDSGEDCWSCSYDCGSCVWCGNGACDSGEDCWSCPGDCGSCVTCGDGSCDAGEDCSTCPDDCGTCGFCGDGVCGAGEDCVSCFADCDVAGSCHDGVCGGDEICGPGEDCSNCPNDCGACSTCGDGTCDGNEDCASCPDDCSTCEEASSSIDDEPSGDVIAGSSLVSGSALASSDAMLAASAPAAAAAAAPKCMNPYDEDDGYLFTHDPSIIKANGAYYVFSTGEGIPIRKSFDLRNWTVVGRVLPKVIVNGCDINAVPAWALSAFKQRPGLVWSPDISYFNGKYHVYYSVSIFGSAMVLVGHATNPTLDETSPSYHWTDHGEVLRSDLRRAVRLAPDGAHVNIETDPVTGTQSGWITLGNNFGWVYQIPLDLTTGLPNKTISTWTKLSRRPQPDGIIRIQEGAYITKRGGYYYMFVNWDFCCGVWNDTYPPYAAGKWPAYRLIVGRSTSLHGPYVGKNGKPMKKGGGTLYLQSNQTTGLVGPGGPAVLEDNGQFYLVLHTYHPAYKGLPLATPQVRKISWTADGWPVDAGPY